MKGIEYFRVLARIVDVFLLPNTSLDDEKMLDIVGPKEARVAKEIIKEFSSDARLVKAGVILDAYVEMHNHRNGSEEDFPRLNLLRKNLAYIATASEEELAEGLNLRDAIKLHIGACFLADPGMISKASNVISIVKGRKKQIVA